MEQLEGKVAVVTGAASGIGRALAHAFAAEGMKVVMADIDVIRLDEAAAELAAGGADVLAVPTDVSDGAAIDALRDAALAAFGAVHVVCNNAGIGAGGAMTDIDVAEWEHVIAVNLWSVLHGIRVFLPLLVEQGEGHMVNTASVAGLYSVPFMGPYHVTKFGVVAASETAYQELAFAGSEVGISVLCPGWVRTGIADAVRARMAESTSEPTVEQQQLEELMVGMLDGFIESGMEPAAVASLVVDAIKAKQFYVLTHAGTGATVRARTDAIAGQRPPPLLSIDEV